MLLNIKLQFDSLTVKFGKTFQVKKNNLNLQIGTEKLYRKQNDGLTQARKKSWTGEMPKRNSGNASTTG